MPIRLSGIEEGSFILICICKLDYSVFCEMQRTTKRCRLLYGCLYIEICSAVI